MGINLRYFNSHLHNIFFCEVLMYDDVNLNSNVSSCGFGSHTAGITGGIPFGSSSLRSGDISGIIWQGDLFSPINSYVYKYDQLSRVTNASFAQMTYFSYSTMGGGLYPNWENSHVDYTMSNVSYDLNGYIKTINHR